MENLQRFWKCKRQLNNDGKSATGRQLASTSKRGKRSHAAPLFPPSDCQVALEQHDKMLDVCLHEDVDVC